MPRRKRCASPSFDDYDEEYDDELSSNGSRSQQPPIQRNAANARERARMRVLSSAFCRLKTKLPWVPADTKLSKLDTLRLATIYIQQLRASLSKDETDDEIFCQANAQSLVWPFSFQQHIDNKQLATVSLNQWLNRGDTNDMYLHATQSSSTKNFNNFINNSSTTHV